MRDMREEKKALSNCFLPIVSEKKKCKNLKRAVLAFGVALLLIILFCALESNIKNSPCRLVIFIRNVIVNIIAREFPDLSVV